MCTTANLRSSTSHTEVSAGHASVAHTEESRSHRFREEDLSHSVASILLQYTVIQRHLVAEVPHRFNIFIAR